ncbi:resistance to phytophthora [Chlorella sorokiniana]|uniref:Resistance to phytophthora n=1 Tax=Chlorella sorokiniana TaxID=3076 RepID=A0A2P6TSP4_CHLSO|nr:resistance to phytophthora [Chlorella sorokiniana]|eukprot:PRW57081.1 resistance to phytophthora [Chlorella sorokiniana]
MALVLAGSRAAACLPPLQAAQQQQAGPQHARCQPFVAGPWRAAGRRRLQRLRAEEERGAAGATQTEEPEVRVNMDIDKEVSKFARNAATTFAPRASGSTGKNPAYKGSLLYTIFEVQAWAALAVGGLLSFNLLLPSDEPNIARLMGMWSIWMFTIPSLRARECTQAEKDALNLLFLAVPLLNVALPFVLKSFPVIFTADCALMAGVYAWKGLIPGLPGAGSGEEGEQQS